MVQKELNQYTQRGWSVIPLHGKTPACANGFKDGTVDMTQIKGWLDKRHKNFGIVTGKASGIVVLDIDPRNGGDKSLQTLVETMGTLPKTPLVQTGGGGWHYYFKYPESAEIRCRNNLYAGIDLKADGGYVVAPPSIHPDSGQAYRWETQPEDVELAELPEWLLLELCPQLETLCDATSNMDIVFTAKPDQADSFITECNQFLETLDLSKIYGPWLTGKKSGYGNFWLECRDPEAPTGDRNPSAGVCLGTESITKGTFHSFRSNVTMPIWEFMIQAKIAGSYTEALEKLADLTGRPIPSSLQKKTRTDEDQAEDIIQEFNQKYAIVSVGSSVRILDESTDAVLFRTEKDFHLLERNRFVRLNDKKIPATKYWLEHPQVRKHKQVVFEPGSTSPEKYNLWKGFAVQPIPGDCSLFLEFVRDIICSGNTEYYKYLMQWMAHAVQSPEIKPGVVIVLQGGQGVGKGFFINTFGHLFGSHYVASAEIENFVGRFNSILMDKLLVFLDECFWGGDRRVASKLKAMITEPSHTIEKKGVDQFSIRNYLRFLIASNDPWVIHAERDERRYFVLEVSDAYQNNRPYFQKIKTQMEEGGYEAFLHHLQTYDLSGFDVGKFPRTPHQLEQKFKSMSVVERFIFERLTEGCLHPDDSYWDGQIEKEKLYTCYCETVKQSGIGKSNWSGEFGKQVLKMIPSIQTKKITNPSGKRCALYLFPPLEECRKSFETYFHAEGMIEWDKGEVMVSPSPNERDEDVSIFFDTTIEEDEEEYSLSFF